MARQVSIGTQDYASLIENNYFYIDKTQFISDWWNSGDAVTLITRPRRFGKTLTMNMCNYFFSNKYAGRSDLFENLNIWKEEKFRKLQGTYPVIFMTFAGVKGKDYADTVKTIKISIAELVQDYDYLLESDKLNDEEKQMFKKIKDDMDDIQAAMSLKILSKLLEMNIITLGSTPSHA